MTHQDHRAYISPAEATEDYAVQSLNNMPTERRVVEYNEHNVLAQVCKILLLWLMQFQSVPADRPQMHEVAVTSSCAGVLLILSASGLSEVCHRTEFNLYRPASVEASLQALKGRCSTLFIRELDIHAANHVICQIITHIQIFNFAKLCKLFKNVFIKVLS